MHSCSLIMGQKVTFAPSAQDLKSANILLARDFTAKIADVGLARILKDDMLSTQKEVGTFAWAAPEVLLGQRTTEAADIYSVSHL